MKIFGYIVAGIFSLILLFVLAFGAEMGALKWAGFFNPKWQNVERQTFEQTQSYTHGKIQDLAKYYEEYTEAEGDDAAIEKKAIINLVKMNFAEFDESTIRNDTLRYWLIEHRGF